MLFADYIFWNFMGMCAVILPASWHWRARNVATFSLICWLFLANLVNFVDCIVWNDRFTDLNPVWSDIASHLLTALQYAIPACSFSQMRRLESVASTRQPVVSSKHRTRRVWQEIAICIAFPILMLPIVYLVQRYRYNIVESIGPGSLPIYPSWPGVLVGYAVPLAITVASLIYACLAIRWFLVRRLQFRHILASGDSNLTASRFFRLMALAATDAVIGLSVTSARLGLQLAAGGFRANTSFKNVHLDFSVISQYPLTAILTTHDFVSFMASVYIYPIYAFIFFAYFGLGEEALADYIQWGRRLGQITLIARWIPSSALSAQTSVLPTLGSKVVSVDRGGWAVESDLGTELAGSTAFAGGPPDDLITYDNRIPVHVEKSVV